MTAVPRLWPGETFILIGAGPSLTPEDVRLCRDRGRVMAINRSIELAPWADVLYACDAKLWKWIDGAPGFAGLKYALEDEAARWGATVLRNAGPLGLEADPTGLRTGKNSGFQAINLAVHLGAARIVLLGYDMAPAHGRENWHADHPDRYHLPSPYPQMREAFLSLVDPLAALGIPVINCSRRTALDVFPCADLAETLAVAVLA